MKKLVYLLTVVALVLALSGIAAANNIGNLQPNGEYYLYQIINQMLVEQDLQPLFSSNADLDPYLLSYNTFAAGDFSVAYYGKQAGYTQNPGFYYLSDPTQPTSLGTYTNNAIASPVGLAFSPTEGWGLVNTTSGGTFYSDTALNTDNTVHWKLYCLAGLGEAYNILFAAYEDLWGGGDFDYNDLVLKIEPNPVPVTGTIWLLGSSLVGLVGLRWRRN